MKILVGFDGSRTAGAAAALARSRARVWGAEVHLATSMKGGFAVPKKEFEHAQWELEREQAGFLEAGIPCKVHLSVRGLEPGEDLVRLAAELEVDEVIIGVKRRSKVGKLVFGSNAQFVVLNAPCPVVTVR